MNKNPQNLVWIDLEMTGLNTFKDRIIEIATIVTDKELNILEEGPVIAIQTPIEDIEAMDGREKSYCRQSIPHDSIQITDGYAYSDPDSKVWIYVLENKDDSEVTTSKFKVVQSYVDVFLDCRAAGTVSDRSRRQKYNQGLTFSSGIRF